MRIAVLASHGGSILQAVLDACDNGELAARVVLVVSNNSNARALARARRAGVATVHLSSVTHTDARALDTAMVDALREARADWVLLAGYMRKLGTRMLDVYGGRIVNTHPALLPNHGGPGLFGRRVHEAVLAAGDRETGATLHLVEAEYDSGPILAQVRVPVCAGDDAVTLEERVKAAERRLVVDTLARLARPHAATG